MESLRAELARAKEQARRSDAAASRVAEELKAERAAHCLSRAEVAELAMKDGCGLPKLYPAATSGS